MKNKKYKLIVAILLWGGMMLFVSAVAADEKPLGWFGIASPTDRTVYIGKDGYKISATLKGVTQETQNIESSLENEQLTFDLEAAKRAKAKWEEERRAEAQKARMDELALQRSRSSNSIVEPEPINRDSDHSMYGVASIIVTTSVQSRRNLV